MAADAPDSTGAHPGEPVPGDLSHAGAVVDQAIDYMMKQNLNSLSIASALLGGALGLLARSLDDCAVVSVLNNAIASVRAGQLRACASAHPAEAAAPRDPAGRA